VVSFHVEAVDDVGSVIGSVGSDGMRAGLAIGPRTPVAAVFPHLESLDRVVVMSVHPGFAGQRFQEGALPRIEALRTEIDRRGIPLDIEVDGGVAINGTLRSTLRDQKKSKDLLNVNVPVVARVKVGDIVIPLPTIP
jgi:ribulose-phosphate 3-epimerase